MRVLNRLLAMTSLVWTFAACAAPTPSVDQVHVLHIESRISQAVVVSVSDRGGQYRYETGLRPCGGRLDLAVGREIPAEGDWMIFLSIDASGRFDSELAAWSGDPHDLTGDYTVQPIWSRGDIRVGDLPEWLSVGQTEPILADAPVAAPISTPCAARAMESSAP